METPQVITSTLKPLSHIPGCKPNGPGWLARHHPGLFRECRIEAGLTSGCIRGRLALPRKKLNMFNFCSRCSGMKKRRELPASSREATEIVRLRRLETAAIRE